MLHGPHDKRESAFNLFVITIGADQLLASISAPGRVLRAAKLSMVCQNTHPWVSCSAG